MQKYLKKYGKTDVTFIFMSDYDKNGPFLTK